jgi:hypothetical protein
VTRKGNELTIIIGVRVDSDLDTRIVRQQGIEKRSNKSEMARVLIDEALTKRELAERRKR